MAKRKKVRFHKVFIGHCTVDSGQILMIDPCYLEDWDHGPYGEGNDYNECCEVSRGYGAGQVFRDLGVIASTAIGDGVYPVYLIIEDDYPVRIEISFEDSLIDEVIKQKVQEEKDKGGAK